MYLSKIRFLGIFFIVVFLVTTSLHSEEKTQATANISAIKPVLQIPTLTLETNALEVGLPQMRIFSPKEYGAYQQNWAFVQNSRGVMYVGNNDGVLEFDGQRWRLIPIANKTIVRSLALDMHDRVYVGAVGEIGYLAPDAKGQMSYVSLMSRVPPEARDFADVLNTFVTPQGIVFSSHQRLMRLQDNQFKTWTPNDKFHLSFRVGERLFIREVGLGLLELVEDHLQLVAGGERFAEEKVYAMLPGPSSTTTTQTKLDRILIGTRTQGFFILDDNDITAWSTNIDAELKRDLFFTAIRLPSGHFVLGTLQGGLYFVDAHGKSFSHMSKVNGLPSDNIWALATDFDGGLWVATQNGLVRMDVASPLSYFDERNGVEGTIYSVHRHQGQLYVATSQGLYRLLPGSNARFKRISGISSQTWALLPVGDQLLVGNAFGVYKVADDNATLIKAFDHAGALLASQADPGRVFVAVRSGLSALRYIEGRWQDEGSVPGIQGEVRTLVESRDGGLWLGTIFAGIFKVYFPPTSVKGELTPIKIERYGVADGLPSSNDNMVYAVGGEVILANDFGIYRFIEAEHRFEPDPRFSGLFSPPRRVSGLVEDSEGGIWMFARLPGAGLEEAGRAFRQSGDTVYQWNSRDLQALRGSAINAVPRILIENGTIWLGGANKLTRFDTQMPTNYDRSFSALLRQVSTRNGRVLYGGSSEAPATTLNYNNNVLRFEFAAPSFDGLDALRFQLRLDGYDNDWSDWNAEIYKDYNNLFEGNYRFRVRAKNLYDTVSEEAEYSFAILPPWYRTVWAYLAYMLLVSGLGWTAIRWRLRRLNTQKRMLERVVAQRTVSLTERTAQLEQSNKNTKTISEISREISAELDFSGLLETVYQKIKSLMPVDVFWIGLYSHEKYCLEFQLAIENNEHLPHFSIHLDDKTRPAVWCFEQQKPLIMDDFQNEYRNYFGAKTIPTSVQGKSAGSIIYCPLSVAGKLIGVFTVQSYQTYSFNEYHKDMVKGLASTIAVALDNARAYRQLEQQKLATADALSKVATLLNSTDEGFLSFKSDLLIETEVSKSCNNILNVDSLTGLNIAELLWSQEEKNKKTFIKGVCFLLKSVDPIQQEFIIGLLPKKLHYKGRSLELYYTLRADKVVMRLTDVTDKEFLQSELELEQHNRKKILYAVVHQNDLLSIIDDFIQLNLNGFFETYDLRDNAIEKNLNELFRRLHTFKGLFLQIYFNELADELHQLENSLGDFLSSSKRDFSQRQNDMETLLQAFRYSKVNTILQEEKETITSTLGAEYFTQGLAFKLTEEEIKFILDQLRDHHDIQQVQKVSALLSDKKKVLLTAYLKRYASAAVEQARRLNKSLSPIKILGDDFLLDPEKYNAFFQSLVHVFRNAVVHGIETPEERAKTNKNESGTLSITVKNEVASFVIQISDDGRGVDQALICKRLISQKIVTEYEAAKLDSEAILKSLFRVGFSTQYEVNLNAGRGIGLPEVIHQLEKLQGTFSITSEPGKGTTFVFVVPK